jgi:hypothetical protein
MMYANVLKTSEKFSQKKISSKKFSHTLFFSSFLLFNKVLYTIRKPVISDFQPYTIHMAHSEIQSYKIIKTYPADFLFVEHLADGVWRPEFLQKRADFGARELLIWRERSEFFLKKIRK